jgi:hypothetical protein
MKTVTDLITAKFVQFESLNRHIVEYYQNGKFIGKDIIEGEVEQSEVGYANGKLITEGQRKFARIFTASPALPFKVVKYNLQGRQIK